MDESTPTIRGPEYNRLYVPSIRNRQNRREFINTIPGNYMTKKNVSKLKVQGNNLTQRKTLPMYNTNIEDRQHYKYTQLNKNIAEYIVAPPGTPKIKV